MPIPSTKWGTIGSGFRNIYELKHDNDRMNDIRRWLGGENKEGH